MEVRLGDRTIQHDPVLAGGDTGSWAWISLQSGSHPQLGRENLPCRPEPTATDPGSGEGTDALSHGGHLVASAEEEGSLDAEGQAPAPPISTWRIRDRAIEGCNRRAGLHVVSGCTRNSRCGGSAVAVEQGGPVSEPVGPAMGATEGVPGYFHCESGGLWVHWISPAQHQHRGHSSDPGAAMPITLDKAGDGRGHDL